MQKRNIKDLNNNNFIIIILFCLVLQVYGAVNILVLLFAIKFFQHLYASTTS